MRHCYLPRPSSEDGSPRSLLSICTSHSPSPSRSLHLPLSSELQARLYIGYSTASRALTTFLRFTLHAVCICFYCYSFIISNPVTDCACIHDRLPFRLAIVDTFLSMISHGRLAVFGTLFFRLFIAYLISKPLRIHLYHISLEFASLRLVHDRVRVSSRA